MNPENVFEAVFGLFVILVLTYTFTRVIFTVQGPGWAVIFLLGTIMILYIYVTGEQ